MLYQVLSMHNFSFILTTVLGLDIRILVLNTGHRGPELSGLTEGHAAFTATGYHCPAPFHHASLVGVLVPILIHQMS